MPGVWNCVPYLGNKSNKPLGLQLRELPAHMHALPCDAVTISKGGPEEICGDAPVGAPAPASNEPSGDSASTAQPIVTAGSAASSGEFRSAAGQGGEHSSQFQSPRPLPLMQHTASDPSSPSPTDSAGAQSLTPRDGKAAPSIETGLADLDDESDEGPQPAPAGAAAGAGRAGGESTAGAAAALLVGVVTAAVATAADAAPPAGSGSASASGSAADVLAAAAATAAAATMFGYVMAPDDGPGARTSSSSADTSLRPSDRNQAEDESASMTCPVPLHHPHVLTHHLHCRLPIQMSSSSRSAQSARCFARIAGGAIPGVHSYHAAFASVPRSIALDCGLRYCLCCGSSTAVPLQQFHYSDSNMT